MLRLNFYKVNFTPNQLVDNLTNYLSSRYVEHIIVNEQLTTPKDYISNNKTLTLRLETNGGTLDEINYSSIAEDDLAVLRYYFIVDKVQVSEFIYDVTFELDVVNTYQDEINTNSNFRNVKVLRQHKNRFVKSNNKYYRIYDRVDENLGDVSQDVSSTTAIDTQESYIVTKGYEDISNDIYKGTLGLRRLIATNTSTTKNVKKYTLTDRNLNGITQGVLLYGLDDINQLIHMTCALGSESQQFIGNAILISPFSTHTIQVAILDLDTTTRDAKVLALYSFTGALISSSNPFMMTNIEGTAMFKYEIGNSWVTNQYLNVSDTFNLSKYSTNWITYTSNVSPISKQLPSISTFNRIDSNVKQIQSMPILPDNLIYFNGEVIVQDDVSSSINTIAINDNSLNELPTSNVQQRDKQYESKLYGSYVTKRQIVYDTFALPILPEYYDGYLDNLYITTYKPNDLSSDLAIKCTSLKCHNINDNILTLSRNSELPIYTSDYLSYIRNGYNYDTKMQSLNKIKTTIGLATGLAGSASNLTLQGLSASKLAGFGLSFLGSAIGTAVSTAGTLANAIISETQNDATLEQKRQSMLVASSTMSGSNSIELFKALNNGNSLKYVISKPRDKVLNSIYDLFYYYGYSDNQTYDVMPTNNSRKYFNYIQADIGNCLVKDVKVRNYLVDAYSKGITFCHKYNNTYLFEDYSLLENWETNV